MGMSYLGGLLWCSQYPKDFPGCINYLHRLSLLVQNSRVAFHSPGCVYSSSHFNISPKNSSGTVWKWNQKKKEKGNYLRRLKLYMKWGNFYDSILIKNSRHAAYFLSFSSVIIILPLFIYLQTYQKLIMDPR